MCIQQPFLISQAQVLSSHHWPEDEAQKGVEGAGDASAESWARAHGAGGLA